MKRMGAVRLGIWLFALVAGARAAEPIGAANENRAARVILLVNSEDPDSARIAHHYAEVRGVPPANIISLSMPLAEAISWREFIVTIWEPLVERLVHDKWIDAIAMDSTDTLGRRKYSPYGHSIAALVVCRGVPLKINHDGELYAPAPPFTNRGEFRTNAGAVDAELSLLAWPNYPINAFVPNPLFQNETPSKFESGQVVTVSRLDGPSVADALGLVDKAVAAERTGLLGRAYIDLSGRDPVGDAWLESAARQLADLGFDTEVDRLPATMAPGARLDAPAIYFGWYSGKLDGPFALPGFQFPPGAIALHIHSFSASTLRSVSSGWTGPLVARGVTATVGNVFEPYLHLTHLPHLLLRALAKGKTLGEAAYFALPGLSWQAVLIGDPLYRPFAVSLPQQLAGLTTLPFPLAGYAALRRMHELDSLGRKAEATALLVKAQHDVPNLALALTLARRLRAAGETEAAANALGFVAMLRDYSTDQWGLVREVALELAQCGRAARAVDTWRSLLAQKLPVELRTTWLADAVEAANGANDFTQALAWQKEIDTAKGVPAEAKK